MAPVPSKVVVPITYSYAPSAKHSDLVVEDCDDFDIDYDADSKPPQPTATTRREPPSHALDPGSQVSYRVGALPSSAVKGVPISFETATALRVLLFGDEQTRFNPAWLQQDFTFSKYTGKSQ